MPQEVSKSLASLKDAPDVTVSRLQERVSRCVKQSHEDEYWIDELAVPVDIAMLEDKLVIQVDGPYHFDHEGSLRMVDKFATALLERFGWKVLRLSYLDTDKRKDDKELEKWIEEEIARKMKE